MQVSVETTSTLGRRVTLTVAADRLDGAITKRLEEARKNLRINGFRPGKVPLAEVKRRYGSAVRQEVLDEVMRESFVEAIQENKLEPVGLPQFEPTVNEAGKDLEFTASFDVFPEIEVGGFDSINVERPQVEIGDGDVDEMIETLRQQRADWEKVDRAAANGDRVNIDYEGRKDGEVFAGGAAKGQNLELGSGSMIPGFEAGIEGLSAGEEKVVPLSFPEDYHAEELKGAAVEFTIKVNAVEAKALPEVDAEFMEAFGVKDADADKFRAEVRKNMERELKNAVTTKVKDQVMTGLIENNEFEVPEALVSNETMRMRQQMMQQFGGGQQFDSSMLPDELFKDQAERSVRLGLIVRSVLEKNEITADADKVRARVEEIAEQYEDPKEVIDYFYGNQQQLQQLEAAVLEEQVVDMVLESAKVEDKAMGYLDAVKPAEQQA